MPPARVLILAALPALTALGTAGCGAGRAGVHEAAPGVPSPKRWTDRFLAPSVLVADEVRIEGPDGLIDHTVLRAISGSHDVKVETLASGFQQTLEQRSGAPAEAIRVQLDQLTIAVARRLVLLERPGPVDVVVEAFGNVFWRDGPTGADVRRPALRIEGKIAR